MAIRDPWGGGAPPPAPYWSVLANGQRLGNKCWDTKYQDLDRLWDTTKYVYAGGLEGRSMLNLCMNLRYEKYHQPTLTGGVGSPGTGKIDFSLGAGAMKYPGDRAGSRRPWL